ncbi:MAG: 3-dehydroquinate synthase [Planctomycetota bacterium]|jgi:3-dehydroquinate synthase|nr:3-dehydroquinate synthase [Planctomycetota bacterium]
MSETVHVDLGPRSYDIRIEVGSLTRAGELIAPHLDGGAALVVADATVAGLHGETLLASLRASDVRCDLVTFAPGEPNKSITTCEQLWKACADAGIDRSGTVIALGGGVSGDMAGFVAATWMRGIRFIQIPTTLLAMVDSSVGGKTGVNSLAGKNLIGAFQQPSFVLIDPAVLSTMDAREYRAGLAEVAKYGVIRDADFFAWMEHNSAALVACDPAAVGHAVAVSCRTKAWYVENDEHEHGVRAHLNYGHTFGHALERETGYKRYLHGEAVAIGMEMAADCAERIGLLANTELRARQTALLQALQLPLVHASDDPAGAVERMLGSVRLDKKARKGQTRFVLPKDFAAIEIVTEPDGDAVRAAFAASVTDSVTDPVKG